MQNYVSHLINNYYCTLQDIEVDDDDNSSHNGDDELLEEWENTC